MLSCKIQRVFLLLLRFTEQVRGEISQCQVCVCYVYRQRCDEMKCFFPLHFNYLNRLNILNLQHIRENRIKNMFLFLQRNCCVFPVQRWRKNYVKFNWILFFAEENLITSVSLFSPVFSKSPTCHCALFR